ILAAHLGYARAWPCAARHVLQQLLADRDRTGEGDACGERMFHQHVADLAPGTRQVVEYARWQSRVADAIGEEARSPRRIAGALDHDGIAGDQRRRDRATGQREREIEW